MLPVVIGLFGVLLLFNVVVTTMVLRHREFSREQKLYQFLFIWLVPILGALVCWSVHREVSQTYSRESKGSNPSDDEITMVSTPFAGFSDGGGGSGGD